MPVRPLSNPFRGLRPFEPDEDHLFFGREKETDELLRRLHSHRFLSVVGPSGGGKSSLVRCGLIPSLYGGFMGDAGSSWRVAILRPGDNPIGRLAEALDAPRVLGRAGTPLASTNRILLEASLRRSRLGLIDAVRLAAIPRDDNVLVLVDQFEELFRFRRKRQIENSHDEAIAFVKLLLDAINQTDVPIYVVLTMRSDFIGDCMDFPGLPEAVNDGQYLVPRMTRDELRAAITGPVAVAGGTIAQRLVLRVLNDAGDDPDQLPLVQHVLMRSWEHWIAHATADEPIDLVDYEAVGTLKSALSRHAEEAFQETVAQGNARVTERVFKALTDTFSDQRGVRRPTSISELAAICQCPESRVSAVVDVFRRSGRSFLMPPADVPLEPDTIVDLSHESLLRIWTRLVQWALDERRSAGIYTRLSREASWHAEGAAGLWSDPELEIGLRWRSYNQPTAAWASRYDDQFDRAMEFLDLSEAERAQQRAERQKRRLRRLVFAWGSATFLLIVLLVVGYFAGVASRERQQAEQNLKYANDAVNNALAVTDRPPETVLAEPPETQALRKALLDKAKQFYVIFAELEPTNERFQQEKADAHFRLGHLDRALGDSAQAEADYRTAAEMFESLADRYPAKLEYKESLAKASNWLGETLRPLGNRRTDAEKAYQRAISIGEELMKAQPSNDDFRLPLAQSYYNRGILRRPLPPPGDPAYVAAEADLRKAVSLLEPAPGRTTSPSSQQNYSRALNNLASLVEKDTQHPERVMEARVMYEQAILIHRNLVTTDQANREYKLELAQFLDNLAYSLDRRGDQVAALSRIKEAEALLDNLIRPTPYLGIEHADAHNLRAHILQMTKSADAAGVYGEALEGYKDIASGVDPSSFDQFHRRFFDLLRNLATLRQDQPSNQEGLRVMNEAVEFYATRGRDMLRAGVRDDAERVRVNLRTLLDGNRITVQGQVPLLTGQDRKMVEARVEALQREFDK
jgi:tetratricopeptide (TPR) repeat protein